MQKPSLPPGNTGRAIPVAKLTALLSLLRKGENRAVITRGTKLLKSDPCNRDLLLILARAYRRSGRPSMAVASLNRVLEQDRTQPQAWVELGNARKQADQPDRAAQAYQTAIDLDPGCFAAWHNLGTLRMATGQIGLCIDALTKAVALVPNQGVARFNLANAHRAHGDWDSAAEHLERALSLGRNDGEAFYLLAAIRRGQGHIEQAMDALQIAVQKDPSQAKATADLLHLKAQNADWSLVPSPAKMDALRKDGEVAPFAILSLQDDGVAQLRQSKAFCAHHWPHVQPSLPARARPADEPLRIGYFTCDVHAHATVDLMKGLFQAHDPARVSVHLYSYDTAPEDAARQALKQSVPQYRDIAELSDQEIAMAARADGLDLAIDLKGHTENARLGIFAQRAAPRQATWLGYPGSTGAPFMDFVIGDAVTIPEGDEKQFSEQVIRLPGSYQVNDDQRAISTRQFTRAELGLPDHAFVFCCFNATYKICARVFALWMHLLSGAPESVLWLLDPGQLGRMHLRTAAEDEGIDPARLFFAPRWTGAEHLSRHRQADLFLDTFAVNAHTTGSDALWAGVPMVTRPGNQFAARVGASLLSACDLPELIATSDTNYLQIALRMARDPAFRQGIQARLGEQNRDLALFDTGAFARNLENAFWTMCHGPK